MKYQKPQKNREEKIPFAPGIHEAVIEKVVMQKSRKDADMFMIFVAGSNGESALSFLVFGNDYVEENLGYILSSIEDNGNIIPDIDYDYNKETADFLTGKEVYIKVKEGEYKGEVQYSIDRFLSQLEYDTIIDTEIEVSE